MSDRVEVVFFPKTCAGKKTPHPETLMWATSGGRPYCPICQPWSSGRPIRIPRGTTPADLKWWA